MISVEPNVRLRAPAENGEMLCVPEWDHLASLVQTNSTRLCEFNTAILDQTHAELSAAAREQALAAALRYSKRQRGTTQVLSGQQPFVLTGHQPEFFHPGVWLKNFVGSRLANRCHGTAINLIIDSDLCRSVAIRVPSGTVETPRIEHVPFDVFTNEVPFEQRKIVDAALWHSFGERVSQTLAPLVTAPLITDIWPSLRDEFRAGDSLTDALVRSRYEREIEWGAQSLELPQSEVCGTEAFYRFALHLFLHAGEFRSAYNSAVADFRTAHHLRNRAQPVPDLELSESWIETPFWIWSDADPQRRGLFVRSGPELEVTDQASFREVLPLSGESGPSRALEQLATWRERGIKIRTRALATTLYARLLLADVFIHGIGGARYDQVTDALCQSFFGVTLPEYATVTGTLRLPIPHANDERSAEDEIIRQLRDVKFHPETLQQHMDCHDGDKTQIRDLIDRKAGWVNVPKTPENARRRHHEITSANAALSSRLIGFHRALESELSKRRRHRRSLQILESREYSYCLHPKRTLREFLSF